MTRGMNRREMMGAGAAVLLGATMLRPAIAAAARPGITELDADVALITGAGGNVVVLRSAEGLLLVDSGEAAQLRALQAQLRAFGGNRKVTTLINTHWHADHTGGNDVFGKEGARIIAHAKARQRMAADQYVPWEDRYIKARRKEALPSKVFYLGDESLRHGEAPVRYGHLLEAHTDGDLYVYFEQANVLVVGDAASPHRDPELAWFEGGWLGGRVDALAKLLTIGNDATRIVAGFGASVTRAELAAEHEALDALFTRMSEAMRKGHSTEDMQKADILSGLSRKWTNPDKFVYDAHKGMWAHHNKLSHQVV